MTETYEQACARATEEQGLATILGELRRVGYPAEPEQTGGMTMVVTVSGPFGFLGVTCDGVDVADDGTETRTFLVCSSSRPVAIPGQDRRPDGSA